MDIVYSDLISLTGSHKEYNTENSSTATSKTRFCDNNTLILTRCVFSSKRMHKFGKSRKWLLKASFVYLLPGDHCYKTSGPGPHPSSCQRIWWLEAGCSMEGSYAPLEPSAYWNSLPVDEVQHDMSLYYQWALDGRSPYSLRCFGTLDSYYAIGAH